MSWKTNLGFSLTPVPCSTHAMLRLQRLQSNYDSLSSRHRRMLPSFGDHLSRLETAIHTNYSFIQCIVNNTSGIFEGSALGNFVRVSLGIHSRVKQAQFVASCSSGVYVCWGSVQQKSREQEKSREQAP